MKKGKLLIISGFSGVGKGTVVKYILDNYSDYKISISATTRSPREGEVDGTHYHFLTTEKFEDMIKNNHADDNYSNFEEHKKIYSKFDTIFAVSEYVKEVFGEKFGNEFKEKTKTSIINYILMVRIDKAKELLLQNQDRIFVVAQKVGFNDTSYFNRIFKKVTGYTPKEFIEYNHSVL